MEKIPTGDGMASLKVRDSRVRIGGDVTFPSFRNGKQPHRHNHHHFHRHVNQPVISSVPFRRKAALGVLGGVFEAVRNGEAMVWRYSK